MMIRQSLQTLKEIAEAVTRDERDDLEVTAVIPGEARGAYAEVLITRSSPGTGPAQMVIGVPRDLPEPDLRRTFTSKLRARV